MLGIALLVKEKLPVLSFLMLWAFLGFLPYIIVPGSAELMVEYRAYLSVMAFAGLVALCFEGLAWFTARTCSSKNPEIIVGIILAVLLVFCINETRDRNRIWKTEFALWNDAVTKSPRKARPYLNRGIVHKERGEYDEAIADFSRALRLNRNYVEAHNNLGVVYVEQGKCEKGIAEFNHALRLDPNCADSYYNRGTAYIDKGEYDKAISDYGHALKLNPKDVQAYYNRGLVYYKKGEYAKALDNIRRAQSLGYQIPQEFQYALHQDFRKGE
jgi:tetratricopeptide (TPR) repeat protein